MEGTTEAAATPAVQISNSDLDATEAAMLADDSDDSDNEGKDPETLIAEAAELVELVEKSNPECSSVHLSLQLPCVLLIVWAVILKRSIVSDKLLILDLSYNFLRNKDLHTTPRNPP